MQFLIGADPELFVSNGSRFVSGWGMIEGTKDQPLKVENGAVQVDGHALEFNIDPASDEEEFLSRIQSVRGTMQAMLSEGLTLRAEPVAEFGMDYLKSMPDESNILGCEPDYNAWLQGEANPRPNGDVDFRTAGGHIHIGWGSGLDPQDPEHQEACQMLVRELDYYLGLTSLFWDNNDQRRSMYGKAGAYRAKSYGVEYRSLSNAWLQTEELIRFVYKMATLAATNLVEGKSLAEMYGGVVTYAINNNDRVIAEQLIVQLFPDVGLDLSVDSIPRV